MKNKLVQLFILHFFNDGFLASIVLLLPFITKDLGLNLTQAGFLSSIFSISGILLSLPSGQIAQKFGPLKILIWAVLFYGLNFIFTGLSSSYLLLVAAFVIGSIGFSIFHPPAISLVAILSDKKTRGRIMGDFTAIGETGRIIISGAISFIVAFIGWRNTAFFYGLIAILLFFLLLFLRNHHKNNEKIKPKSKNQLSYAEITKNKSFILVLFISFFDLLASSALFVFLPFLLLKKGINPSVLSAFTSAFFFGNLIGKMVFGRLSDRFPNTKVFIFAESLMILFILLLTYSNSVPLIIIFSIVLGSLTMGTVPIRTTMISDTNEHHDSNEKAFAIGAFTASISNALAPIILGRVSDLYGIINSFNLSALFAFFAIIPAFMLSRRRHNDNSAIL